MSLINCIDQNFIKQNLVETMVRFANEHGAMVIAEGVERKEEYDMVKSLGVHLVQGFYVHKPSTSAVTYRPPVLPPQVLTEPAEP
jgi:EAL domain-containing protein (putative c-di-GMP-specific phosphodiesterase class I)